MPVQKGDLIDEGKQYDQSCRLLVEVLDGGGGFSKIDCCGNELTDADKVSGAAEMERAGSDDITGVIIDESKNNPDSCGLKVRVVAGGAGLSSITCCGNTLTIANDAV